MHERLQRLKKTLQIPLVPLITGSSPWWIKMELMLKPASLPQTPTFPCNLSVPQLRGQILQEANGSSKKPSRDSGKIVFTMI